MNTEQVIEFLLLYDEQVDPTKDTCKMLWDVKVYDSDNEGVLVYQSQVIHQHDFLQKEEMSLTDFETIIMESFKKNKVLLDEDLKSKNIQHVVLYLTQEQVDRYSQTLYNDWKERFS